MFTSDTDRRSCIKQAAGTGAGAAFTALFGGIYELFSHSVYSYFMIYAFAPLMIMSIVYVYWGGFSKRPPKRAARNLFTASAACCSVGMLAAGVVIIYGSTNKLLIGYYFLAGATFITALIAHLADRISTNATTSENV